MRFAMPQWHMATDDGDGYGHEDRSTSPTRNRNIGCFKKTSVFIQQVYLIQKPRNTQK
jgi:hypothetical protein